MAYDKALISHILRQLEQQRQQREAEAEERRYHLTRTIPRLREIDRELRTTAARAVRIAFESNNTDRAIDELRARNLALQAERRRWRMRPRASVWDFCSAFVAYLRGARGDIGKL